MLKKILIYSLLSIFLISSAWNFYYSFIHFISTNLSVRQSYYFPNDVKNKGTHQGGEAYRLTTRKHKLELAKFNYSNVLKSFVELSHIDPLNTNFSNEYELIMLLYELGTLPNSLKRESALFIPKTFTAYWNLSCDTHMPPFVAPAIANMAMIEGLPLRAQKNSCYSHFNNYGYSTYKIRGIKAKWIEMDHEKICQKAKLAGFKRIIEINENKIGEITTIYHECGG
jgi:hypothetical protein